MESSVYNKINKIDKVTKESSKQPDYKRLFDCSPVPLIELNSSGKILRGNKAAAEIFNCIEEKIQNKYLYDLVSNESKKKIAYCINQLANRKTGNITKIDANVNISKSETATLRFKFSKLNVPKSSSVIIIASAEDISNYDKEQQNLLRYYEEIQVVRDDLEERTNELALLNEKLRKSEIQLADLNKNKDRFFSIISHDLRSPFNSLLGLTNLILENFDSFTKNELKESINNLNRSSHGLYNLLEDLLDWSKAKFNIVGYQSGTFNLYEVVSFVINSLKAVTRNKNISVINHVPENYTINADQHIIKTIVRNLVSNAIKFTPKDGTITITSGFYIDEFIISIEDSGVGMSKEVVLNLFNMEKKVSSAGTEGESGTGLGLFICKELIAAHGGRIWAKSELQKGSKFFISIPIEQIAKESTSCSN